MNLNDNYLLINNLTRNTPRYYQCRASNGIPPNDNRNFTYKIKCMLISFFLIFKTNYNFSFSLSLSVAPEVEIEQKYNRELNEMELNCTINAFPPLINKYFWRKNGNYLSIESMKYKIENKIINDYKIISKLTIKVSSSLSF
jgi:hypothetical protein